MALKYFSIISKYQDTCFLCGSHKQVEIHHIYNGALRRKSTKYGLVVPLCYECHRGQHGVHNDHEKMMYLKRIGQTLFERYYPNEDFLKVFHKNYLGIL